MTAATVLFTDIVAFSKKRTVEQRRLVELLASEVSAELGGLLTAQTGVSQVVALPTGDGLALAFLHADRQQWSHSAIIRLALRMHRWAHGQSTESSEVCLRVGVHVGAIELISDINGKQNVCGDTINYAQRVMDAANPRQILYSDAAFREHVGTESELLRLDTNGSECVVRFQGAIEVLAKHGLQIHVYKAHLEPSAAFLSDEDPASKQHMLVSLTPLPKEVVGTFSERISRATQIAFIQLTGDRFLSNFGEGKITFSPHLKRFWVFMPSPDIYSGFELAPRQATTELVSDYVKRWEEFFSKLKATFPGADLKLGLFKEPPYFGASFIDWDYPLGKIHVSPYIWGVTAHECPGYDVQWVGSAPSEVYERYVRGLHYLDRNTVNVLRPSSR
jgi:hypothetical protein